MTTDYVTGTGDPEPYLRRISNAGFSHIHWCHEWSTDYLYPDAEIESIKQALKKYDLKLLDLHASSGVLKNWASNDETERNAGKLLVQNRINMAEKLNCNVIIMHVPEKLTDSLLKSLDSLETYARNHSVRIAIENGPFDVIKDLFSLYGPDYLGLCYDAGHGNLDENGLENLDRFKERLISIHLHDNDGIRDLHNLLFSGTLDWKALAKLIAASSYDRCVSMEVVIYNSGIQNEALFLEKAFETGTVFSQMIAGYRE
jgi:sugar phosphate isomerase/epimerase